jgi:hypothetical protein
MKCYYHKDKEAVGFCGHCGKAICSEDSADVKGKTYCYKCMRDILQDKKVAPAGPVPEKKEEKKKEIKRPGILTLISVLMILGGLLEILVTIIAYITFMSRALFNLSMLASSGFMNIQLGGFIIYGLLIMIAGKKLKNLKRWGFYLTYFVALITILPAPSIMGNFPEPLSTFYTIAIVFFILTMLYLIKVRKLFFGGKSEKKKKS